MSIDVQSVGFTLLVLAVFAAVLMVVLLLLVSEPK